MKPITKWWNHISNWGVMCKYILYWCRTACWYSAPPPPPNEKKSITHPPTSAAYMRQRTSPALVQVMACRLFGAASSHYLNQCWLIVNWTPGNRNSIIFILKMHLKLSSVKMAAILTRGDELISRDTFIVNAFDQNHPSYPIICHWFVPSPRVSNADLFSIWWRHHASSVLFCR